MMDACTLSANLKYHEDANYANLLLNTLTGTKRWLPEMLFVTANLYYKDDNYKNTYLLTNASNALGPGYTFPNGGIAGSSFGGSIQLDAATYFQKAENEDLFIVTPSVSEGNLKLLLM